MSKKFLLFLLPLVVLLAAPGVYFYQKYQKVTVELKKMSPQSKEEIFSLLSKVGKLIELPNDEEPSVATVTDKEKLTGQSFFAKSENGDQVIIYTKASKAILYRPSANKIIEVARVDTTSSIPNPTVTPEATIQTPIFGTLSIYNGTEGVGLSQKFADFINGKAEVKVGKKLNASRKDYVTSMVIDLTKKITPEAQKIANLVSGGVLSQQIPDGEATPSADILVILGSDFTGQ